MEPRPSLYEEPLFRRAAGKTLRPGGLDLTRDALDLAGWPKGAMVAEVGCGAGATLKLLEEMGFGARGFDLSPDLVAEAAEYCRCPIEVADAAALPMPDESFDGVVCECVLSLLPAPKNALAEFARVLKPGGGLLLSDVTRRADETPATVATGTRRSCLEGALTATANIQRLEEHGFQVLHTLDQTKAFTALAVQLVWEGCGLAELGKWLGFSCEGGSRGKYGYTQWIAVKRTDEMTNV